MDTKLVSYGLQDKLVGLKNLCPLNSISHLAMNHVKYQSTFRATIIHTGPIPVANQIME